jgi:hypothetical protein
VTTAVTSTQPVFRVQTNAGGNGYKNQDGTSKVGSYSSSLRNVTKAAGFGMILPLELGDCAVTDVTQIRVDTAAAAGAATIYGFEPMMMVGSYESRTWGWRDGVFGGPAMAPMNPAAATSGTAASFLGTLSINAPDQVTTMGVMAGVVD